VPVLADKIWGRPPPRAFVGVLQWSG